MTKTLQNRISLPSVLTLKSHVVACQTRIIKSNTAIVVDVTTKQ